MRTPLYDLHVKLKGKIVDFHGWELPIQYSGIVEEHNYVRNKCGIFDVSHMGEIIIEGRNAFDFIQYLIPNDLKKIHTGKALYTPLCYEHGGIVDDIIIYEINESKFFIVVNASNIQKDFEWFQKYEKLLKNKNRTDLKVKNESSDWAQIAIQGPLAVEIVEKAFGYDLKDLGYFNFVKFDERIISRTGYTGEDGFEIFTKPDEGALIYERLLTAGKENIVPCGLGARDSLRTEAGYMLYGNDIDEKTSPLEAPLGWTVKLEKGDFVGKTALVAQKEKGITKKLLGFEMEKRKVARSQAKVFSNKNPDEEIGHVTSGIFSPTFQKPIGFAYLKSDNSMEKDALIEVHNSKEKAVIRDTRFYKRNK